MICSARFGRIITMTNREAIECMEHLNEHQHSTLFKSLVSSEQREIISEGIRLSISALQEREERARGCECKSHIITHSYTDGYSIEIDPKRKEIAIWLHDECVSVMGCAFCPRCGRKLKE